MYNIINKTTGESESMSEKEALAKYGTDKVNSMMFGLDPDLSLMDTDGDVDMCDLDDTLGDFS